MSTSLQRRKGTSIASSSSCCACASSAVGGENDHTCNIAALSSTLSSHHPLSHSPCGGIGSGSGIGSSTSPNVNMNMNMNMNMTTDHSSSPRRRRRKGSSSTSACWTAWKRLPNMRTKLRLFLVRVVPRPILWTLGILFLLQLLLLLLALLGPARRTHDDDDVRLPVANVDVPVPNATEWPLLHIVNTRFMQEQGLLTTLGMARLHLFQTFSFPTMIAQSTQDFLWIIKTDPLFASLEHNPVFVQLVDLVQPYPNIYIVASNQNFLISPDLKGCWRDGAEGRDLMQSRIFTGNITKLHQAIALREERPVLETRLDADDGLHVLYLQYMQYVAMKRFFSTTTTTTTTKRGDNVETKWLYWCTRRHLEWRVSPMKKNSNSSSNDNSNNNSSHTSTDASSVGGFLNPVEHSRLCITPGITVGYNVGVRAEEVPSESHDLLYKHLADSTACLFNKQQQQQQPQDHTQDHHHTPAHEDNENEKEDEDEDEGKEEDEKNKQEPACLNLVDDLLFSAIRSRTLTSAGMQDVASPNGWNGIPTKKNVKADKWNNQLWALLEDRFHINRTMAQNTQRYLTEHSAQIAYENLLGQCTSFHSCKQGAKEELQKYIDKAKIIESDHDGVSGGVGVSGDQRNIQLIHQEEDDSKVKNSRDNNGGGLRAANM